MSKSLKYYFSNTTFMLKNFSLLGAPQAAQWQRTCLLAGDSGDRGSVPESEKPPGGGNGNPLSILAREIPWTEESGGLLSTGSQRVRHDLMTKQQ